MSGKKCAGPTPDRGAVERGDAADHSGDRGVHAVQPVGRPASALGLTRVGVPHASRGRGVHGGGGGGSE